MLFQQSDYESVVVGVADAIWIGHNRAATIGVTSRANAHPFQCNHITGVHNGTLEKASFGALADRLSRDYGTDSETIYQHMAVYGVDDTVSRLQGAWALVWYDEKEETLNMLKNDKRPLYLCKIERDGTQILTWASEYKMIVAARAMADTNDGKVMTDADGFGFFPLPDNMLHTWTKKQLLAGDLEATVRELKGMPPLVSTTVTTMGFTSNPKPVKTATFNLVEDAFEINKLDIEDSELVLGVMEQSEWDEISKFGCSCCGADVSPDEKGIVVYVNEGVVVCPKCSQEDETIVSNAFGLNLSDRIMG